jgi:hypothetical protein
LVFRRWGYNSYRTIRAALFSLKMDKFGLFFRWRRRDEEIIKTIKERKKERLSLSLSLFKKKKKVLFFLLLRPLLLLLLFLLLWEYLSIHLLI